ncbi:MAG: hypothetical protein E7231_12745 [Cellulosilyticum sp.]|nr:hypothetical protein [Cellulosilyticum sp.]
MSELNDDIRRVIREELKNAEIPSNFERVWDTYNSKQENMSRKSNKKRWKAILVAACLATISVSSIAAISFVKRVENSKSVFEYDSNVVGYWEVIDIVDDIEQYDVHNRISDEDEFWLLQCIFEDDGDVKYVIKEGEKKQFIQASSSTWSKGVVWIEEFGGYIAQHYEIKNIDGEEYMFLEQKNGDYVYGRVDEPYYFILKKTDGLLEDIEIPEMRIDDTNIPFVYNEEMIGKWKAVACEWKIEDWQVGKVTPDLPLQELEIKENEMVNTKGQGETYIDLWRWSDTKIINLNDSTVMNCILKEIDGDTYMFMEWKSGDYTDNGRDPAYYILKKEVQE